METLNVAQGISFLVVVYNRAVLLWKHVKNSLGTKKVYENIVFRCSEKHNFKRITVFWDMLVYGLAVGSQCFGGTYCCHLQGVPRGNRFLQSFDSSLPN